MAYEVLSFGVSLFRLCCGCVEGMKGRQWALLSRKRLSRLHLLQFIAAQKDQQTFTITCCVAHLLCSCKKEAFGSSPRLITGSNSLLKGSKADVALSLYTLPHFSILTHFTPQLPGSTLLQSRVNRTSIVPCERVNLHGLNPGSPHFRHGPCERGIGSIMCTSVVK